MRTLTTYVLRHRALVLALLGFFIFAGVMAFLRLPVEAYPDVTNVQAQVITLWPGHATEEVEKFVTIPVENQMNSIPKRVALRSVSLFGLSQVTITFEDDADNAYCRNQVVQLLQQVNLPAGAQASISPDSTAVGEVYRYTLRAPKGFPSTELRSLEDWVVERELRTVPGVVDVVGFGGPTKQYQVLVDPLKLKSYDIALHQVFDALSNGNRNAGGAYIEHGPQIYIVRGIGLVRDLRDIERIAVVTRNGKPITIGDVGTVTVGHQLRLGRVGLTVPAAGKKFSDADENDVVEGIVLLRRGENPLDGLKRIEAKVDGINKHALPPGVRLNTIYDRTELIDRTLHTVRENMLIGIGLVLAVLLVYLGFGNFRSALVVAAVVPLSLLGAFMLLDWRGIPANLISMGAIDFGIIVDASVVIVEDLLRILAERGKSLSVRDAIRESVSDMGKPIIVSKLILITAFIPLFTLQRVEGRIFKPMALTLTFALIAGTILAIVAVPALASFALEKHAAGHEPWLVRWLNRIYTPLQDLTLKFRWPVMLCAAGCLAVGGVTLHLIGTEFLPKLDEGALWVRATMPKSISPTEANRVVVRIRETLSSFPEVKSVVSQLGRPDDGTDVNGFDTVELYVDLRPREQWSTASERDGLVAAMNGKLAAIPGVDFLFSQYIEDNVNEAVSGIKGELGIKIFGDDPTRLQELADRVAAVVKTVPGAYDVGAEELLGQSQVQIEVDRDAIARAGLAMNDVQSVVETAFGGSVATQVKEDNGRSFDLVVKLPAASVSNIELIRDIPVQGGAGEKLTLGGLAAIRVRAGFDRIYREENVRRIAVKFSVRDRDLGSVVGEAQKKVAAAAPMPPGYRLQWTGSFENQQRAVSRLLIVVPITFLAIFFLLFTAFDSGRMALLILLNVPFAAVGGLLGLASAGLYLSVSAMMGLIAVFGVSIQNGVLLVERIRDLRALGKTQIEAVKEGGRSRLRQVTMTSAMAMFGLLPAALSHGVGAETSRPFAVAIIGGLVTSTLLTLFILPLLYPLFETKAPETVTPETPTA